MFSKYIHKCFIFDKNFYYKNLIDLTSIKKISSDGKYSFAINFFGSLSEGSKLRITFLSQMEKEKFLKEIFSNDKNNLDFYFKKIVFVNFFCKNEKLDISMVNNLINYMKMKLKKKTKYYHRIYYNKDVYEFLNSSNFSRIINKNSFNFKTKNKNNNEYQVLHESIKIQKNIFFLFNSYKICDVIIKNIIYGIKIIKQKQKYLKEIYEDFLLNEIDNESDNNKNIITCKNINNNLLINKRKSKNLDYLPNILNKNLKNKFKKALSLIDEKKNNIKKFSREFNNNYIKKSSMNFNDIIEETIDSIEDTRNSLQRFRHIQIKAKIIVHNEENISNKYIFDSLIIKNDFEKVSFQINILYFFSKESKILDVNKEGIFNIYKKGKVILL